MMAKKLAGNLERHTKNKAIDRKLFSKLNKTGLLCFLRMMIQFNMYDEKYSMLVTYI